MLGGLVLARSVAPKKRTTFVLSRPCATNEALQKRRIRHGNRRATHSLCRIQFGDARHVRDLFQNVDEEYRVLLPFIRGCGRNTSGG
jgi:hypothetical protein